MAADSPERLQKVLARAGLGSRRVIEGWIRAGRLTVNGAAAQLGSRIGERDQVRLDGRPVRWAAPTEGEVFLVHRSTGEPLRETESGTTTPMSARLPRRSGRRYIAVSPMPPADGGLELLTADGALAARLQRAVRRLPCAFSVRVHGQLEPEAIARVALGELDSGARVRVVRCEPAAGGEGRNHWYDFEALGASGRDVRQLFAREGVLVSRVLRTGLGSVRLGRELGRGRFRRLEPDELTTLISGAGAAAEGERAAAASAPPPCARRAAPAPRPRLRSADSRKSRPSPRARVDREA